MSKTDEQQVSRQQELEACQQLCHHVVLCAVITSWSKKKQEGKK